jgi:hypothetical protein
MSDPARIGNAAFLLPAGRKLPDKVAGPLILKWLNVSS